MILDLNGRDTDMDAVLTALPAGFLMFIPFFVLLFVTAGFAMQILGLVEAVSRPDFAPAERVAWTLAIFFFQLLGVVIYLFATDGKNLKTRAWLKNITILNVAMILLMIVVFISAGVLAIIMR